jgi:hypothetical protein
MLVQPRLALMSKSSFIVMERFMSAVSADKLRICACISQIVSSDRIQRSTFYISVIPFGRGRGVQ